MKPRSRLQSLASEYVWFRYLGIRMCRGMINRIASITWVGADTRYYLMQATRALLTAEKTFHADWKKERQRLKR